MWAAARFSARLSLTEADCSLEKVKLLKFLSGISGDIANLLGCVLLLLVLVIFFFLPNSALERLRSLASRTLDYLDIPAPV